MSDRRQYRKIAEKFTEQGILITNIIDKILLIFHL